MIYITGDTHGDFSRFSTKRFPEQKNMTKDDFLIICGDFGGIWTSPVSDNSEKYNLDWLEEKPFTILFVDGNHENFDRLKTEFPPVDFHGGKAHKIRSNIFHLMRGYVFEFNEKSFFTFGGAKSHDITDGILNAEDYPTLADLRRDFRKRTSKGQLLRINHLSWWEDELAKSHEMERGIRELEKVGFEVDFVVTHCAPTSVARAINEEYGTPDILSEYLSEIADKTRFSSWHFGHFHEDKIVDEKFILHYKGIERIV